MSQTHRTQTKSTQPARTPRVRWTQQPLPGAEFLPPRHTEGPHDIRRTVSPPYVAPQADTAPDPSESATAGTKSA